ncbi:PAS domain-containing protein [Rhodocytophaga rosea]|uniref:histidine kinase n=1 Tax=Rhodocytophaga rosea TaxID=2704465 RepID=A0A6C0GQ91_9BACT|nr:PAS domain-containing protein [Rhodocytophaga rosea]QHT70024.1 PAS domain-containing protein [Rhodocytophaga rosea]
MSKFNGKPSELDKLDRQVEKIETLVQRIRIQMQGSMAAPLQKKITSHLEKALAALEKIEEISGLDDNSLTPIPDPQPPTARINSIADLEKFAERMEFMFNEAPAILFTGGNVYPYGMNFISPNVESITGYKPEEFTSDAAFWRQHIHPEEVDPLYEQFADIFKKGSYTIEYRFLFKDGTYHWIHDQGRIIYDQEGRFSSIIGCMIDITEKKEAEAKAAILLKETQSINEELRSSEEELMQTLDKSIELNDKLAASEQFNKRIISSVNEGIAVFDTDLRYVVWNKYLADRMGITQEQVLGKRPAELFPFLETFGFSDMIKQALEGETVILPDTFVRTSDSSGGWIAGSFNPLTDPDNKIIGIIGVFSIITARKQAEIALLEQKNLLQAFYNAAHFYMCVFELTENNFIYKLPNQHMAAYFGHTIEEITGKTATELGLDQEIIRERVALFKNCIETGKTMQKEYMFPKPDGSYGWHFGSFSPIPESNSVSVISFDISERKQMEEEKNHLVNRLQELNTELERSQSSLKESQKIARLGTWEFDAATQKVIWSEEMYKIFGLDPSSEAPTMQAYKLLIHPDFRETAIQITEQGIASGKEFEMEIKILPTDTDFRWNYVIGRPILDRQGKMAKLMGVTYDITERKVAQERIANLLQLSQEMNDQLLVNEEELRESLEKTIILNEQIRESEQRWQFALEGSGDGLWDWNLATEQVFYSRRYKELMGIREDEKIEGISNWASRIHPDDIPAAFKSLNDYLAGETDIYQIECRTLVGDNQYRWFLGRGKVIELDETGKPLRMIGTMSDITERKQIEEKLRQQNDDLKKINQELDSFVYRASHDLRAPLASILGLINISRLEENQEIKANYLNMMEKSISKLDTFISEIINYSRNSRIEVSKETIDVPLLMKEILEGLKFMEGFDEIEKKVTIQQTATFVSDVFRLKIILNNLLSNAVKYRAVSSASFVMINITIHQQSAVFEFTDNGLGIAAESLDKIFNMFYRASETSKGSGIGLYIVKDAIHTLKGSIAVESELGKGTCFRVELPNEVL